MELMVLIITYIFRRRLLRLQIQMHKLTLYMTAQKMKFSIKVTLSVDLKICQYFCLHIKIVCRRFHIKTPFTFWDTLTWVMWKVYFQIFRNNGIRWKLAYFLRNAQTSRTNNSRIRRITNAKFSEYCHYMDTNILGGFQICISVPLRISSVNVTKYSVSKYLMKNFIFCAVYFLNIDQVSMIMII